MSTELGVIAAGSFLAFALVGWLAARWIERHERRPGPLWLIVPVAGLLGVAGYVVAEATGARVAVAAVGAAVGIAIALLLLLAWQRRHPVIRGTAGVYGLTGLPCSALDDMSDETARDLLRRWLTLSSDALTRVAIVPAEPELGPAAGRAAAWLHGLQTDADASQSSNGSERPALPPAPPESDPDPESERRQWRSRWARPAAAPAPAPAPSAAPVVEPAAVHRLVLVTADGDAGELEQEDLIVLLARDGMRCSRLVEAAGRIEDASRRADWVLLVRSDDSLPDPIASKPTNGSHS
ncbi:MAG: hypothetical protein JW895_10185 [Thermoleophilaceae bacterium]|nr:hypothetical protein [Thermoleophilaceae bacterium]